jgi:3-oxoacyl-[acyl-carrier-protein] synthase-3
MGIQAAREAIKDADIDPEEIDLVIWNGAQHKDYICWLAGLKVANAVGAVNAWSFDMEAMCGSMMIGIETAKAHMMMSESVNTVLLASGYRNGDLINYKEKDTSFMFDLAAGGAAIILQKGLDRNIVMASSFKGDGSFSEDCTVKPGGTKNWPLESIDTDNIYFTIKDIESFKNKLAEQTMPNFFEVIKTSLKKSGGLEIKDIDYLAILHFKKSTHEYILDKLGLNNNQTTYLDEFGHIGQNDQIISIIEGLKTGKIKDGSNIVLAGAGIGFVWASTVIRWGKREN